jgi:hypothetical protein
MEKHIVDKNLVEEISVVVQDFILGRIGKADKDRRLEILAEKYPGSEEFLQPAKNL